MLSCNFVLKLYSVYLLKGNDRVPPYSIANGFNLKKNRVEVAIPHSHVRKQRLDDTSKNRIT